MKKELTTKQCVDLYNSIANLKQGGIYVKALKNVDLAMNKSKVAAIVEGYKIATDPPEAYSKFAEEVESLKLQDVDKEGIIRDPQKTHENLTNLKLKYASAIEEYDIWKKSLKGINEKKYKINLIMLNREDFNFADESNSVATEIMFGLLPCISMEKDE